MLPLSEFAYWGAHELCIPPWVVSIAGLCVIAIAQFDAFRREVRVRFWTAGRLRTRFGVEDFFRSSSTEVFQ